MSTSAETPASRLRPWLVMGHSHEHEWNGRVGRRFTHENTARLFALRMEQDGWYDVRVVYSPAQP